MIIEYKDIEIKDVTTSRL